MEHHLDVKKARRRCIDKRKVCLQLGKKIFSFQYSICLLSNIILQWLDKRNIPHFFIPKKSPWWNGYVEEIHRTIDEEFY